MNRRVVLFALTMITGLSAGVQSQQSAGSQAAALPAPVPRDPSWAFQVIGGSLPTESAEPKTVPGSSKRYTPTEIDDLNSPPDWLPEQHPAAPAVIQKGRQGVFACGACHLMSGLGHPESADLTGQTATYLIRQMADFKAGTRTDFAARMNGFAKNMTDEEIRQASEYFASLPRRKTVRVVEASMVPKTIVGQGRMRFLDPKASGQKEPIGTRIIIVPEDEEQARHRDPRTAFIAYVPPGSVRRGRALAETSNGTKTVACAYCHGEGLKGLGNVPRLAGVHPIYLARQLYHFREGGRKGADSALMMRPTAKLTDEDIVNLSAYAASLSPE